MKSSEKKLCNPKIYGMVTVNAKWQIVIPSEARHQLNIQAGDQFVVVAKDDFGFGFIKADTLQEFLLAAQQEHPEAFEIFQELSEYKQQ